MLASLGVLGILDPNEKVAAMSIRGIADRVHMYWKIKASRIDGAHK